MTHGFKITINENLSTKRFSTENKAKGTLVHERGLEKYIPWTSPCVTSLQSLPHSSPGSIPRATYPLCYLAGYPRLTPRPPLGLGSSLAGKFKLLSLAHKILSKSSPSLIPLTTQYLERGAKAIRAQKQEKHKSLFHLIL